MQCLLFVKAVSSRLLPAGQRDMQNSKQHFHIHRQKCLELFDFQSKTFLSVCLIQEDSYTDGAFFLSARQVQTPRFGRQQHGEQLQTCATHQWTTCVLCQLRQPNDSFCSNLFMHTFCK